jgi:hypothetical protein
MPAISRTIWEKLLLKPTSQISEIIRLSKAFCSSLIFQAQKMGKAVTYAAGSFG